MSGENNTIVTIGDINYLWGIFMLIASARKAGMREPFLVGVKKFTPRAEKVLTQFGDVRLVPLDGLKRSLTSYKAKVMLEASTEYVTWADSDAFFTGDVSSMLPPDSPDGIHFRMRGDTEFPGHCWKKWYPDSMKRVPAEVLEVWREDVRQVAGEALAESRTVNTGTACFFSLSLARHRRFLEIWDALQDKVLPEKDVGVVDNSLRIYPQLDESTLNACLDFLPAAPKVQELFKLDKQPGRMFIHFIMHPKPWVGWTKRAFRFFDEYTSVVKWAADNGYELPGPVPPCLDAANKRKCRILIPWTTFSSKVKRRLARMFK